MNGQRHREDIIYDILRTAAEGPVPLTRIMARVGLTTSQTRAYLGYAISKDLLQVELFPKSSGYQYRTTPKGIVYVNMIDTIRDILPNKK